MGNSLDIHSRGCYRMKRRYSYIAIILIMCILSACHNTKEESDSTAVNNTSTTTEVPNDISDEIRDLLKLGEYDDIELKGDDRDAVSIVKNNQRFLFPECKVLSVTYTTFSEDATFLSLNKKEVLELINLIEESPILKDGDSLSNYGVKDDTQEKYAKICIIYKNSHGEVQNVWLNTFKGDVLHFYDSLGEDYRIGPNKKLVKFIMKHTGYRVLSTTDFDKIERIVVKYNNEEYQLSAKKTKQFIKTVKKLDKRQDEFHDSNLTALAYTSDGDVYHIKAGVGEYSENDIAIEGACYEGTENVVRLLEK